MSLEVNRDWTQVLGWGDSVQSPEVWDGLQRINNIWVKVTARLAKSALICLAPFVVPQFRTSWKVSIESRLPPSWYAFFARTPIDVAVECSAFLFPFQVLGPETGRPWLLVVFLSVSMKCRVSTLKCGVFFELQTGFLNIIYISFGCTRLIIWPLETNFLSCKQRLINHKHSDSFGRTHSRSSFHTLFFKRKIISEVM